MKTKVIKISPKKIRLLENNARFMRHEMYQTLVRNVKRDGVLTQIPFGALYGYYEAGDEITYDENGDPVYEVLSGNHRVKAALAAGIEMIDFQVTDDPVDFDHRLGIQLSHNAVSGEDDPAVLSHLYEQIKSVEMRVYSGLDDKVLELLQEIDASSLSEANLDFQLLNIVFLPREIELAVKAIETAKAFVPKNGVWYAAWSEYDALLDSLDVAAESYHVKNVATSFLIILDVFQRHITDMQKGWLDDDGTLLHGSKTWVPMSTVLGTASVPSGTAKRLKKVVDTMVSKKEIEKDGLWDAMNVLIDVYNSR